MENGLIFLPFNGTNLYFHWHSFLTHTRSVEWNDNCCVVSLIIDDGLCKVVVPFWWILVNRSCCLSIHCMQQPTLLFKHSFSISYAKYRSRKCKWNKLTIYSVWILLNSVECFGSEWDTISLYSHKSFLCDKIYINSKPVDF